MKMGYNIITYIKDKIEISFFNSIEDVLKQYSFFKLLFTSTEGVKRRHRGGASEGVGFCPSLYRQRQDRMYLAKHIYSLTLSKLPHNFFMQQLCTMLYPPYILFVPIRQTGL